MILRSIFTLTDTRLCGALGWAYHLCGKGELTSPAQAMINKGLPPIFVAVDRAYIPPGAYLPDDYMVRGAGIRLWPWWHPLIIPRIVIMIIAPGWLLWNFCPSDFFPGAIFLTLYLHYTLWMVRRYICEEAERRYVVRVLRSHEWLEQLAGWMTNR